MRNASRYSADETRTRQLDPIEPSEQSHRDLFRVEELLGSLLDLLGGYSVDVGDDLVAREEVAEINLLACEVGHARARAFEAHEDVALELVLGAGQFLFAERLLLKLGELGHDEVDAFKRLTRRGAGVDAETAGVAVGRDVGVDRVSHAALFTDGLEEARAHAAAEDGVKDERDVAVGVRDGRRGDAEADLDLFESLFVAEQDFGRSERGWLFHQGSAGGKRAEFFGYGSYELVMMEVAGGREDYVAGVELAGVIVEKARLVKAGNCRRGAEDGLSERVVLPEVLREELVDQNIGVVFVDLDLFEDDATLALDVGRVEDGIQDEVAEDVEGDGDVLGEGLDVEADSFLAGEGVEVAADGVHFPGDVLGGTAAGAFEDHVFDEVGDAVDCSGLGAGAGFDPGAHGDRAKVLHALSENDEAVGEDGAAKITFNAHVLPIF